MKQSTSGTSDNLAVITEVVPNSERRSVPRIDCHTVVTAVSPQSAGAGEPMQVIKAYSEDVSISGARLIAQQPISCDRLFLRFLLPTFGDRYVEAEVVSRSQRERRSMKGSSTIQYVYGVRFTGKMADGATLNPRSDSPDTE